MKTTLKRKSTHHVKKQFKTELSFFEILKRFLVVWFLMFFCSLLITQQDSFWLKISNSPDKVVFLLPWTPNDWWINENELWSHWAAWDWSYLFEDEETNQQVYTPTQTPSYLETPTPEKDDIISVDKDYSPEDNGDIFYEWINDINNIYITWDAIFTWNIVVTWSEFQWQICITPWWEYVANWDFVLAYEQRKDVTNLCNVQKRYCENGKLNGSYNQKSCKEHTLYSYVNPEAISYTQKPIDPFIQPNQPSLSDAEFDTHGKINGTTDPIDVWWSPSSDRPTDVISTSQTSPANIKCVTPWGEIIQNWQFIKAYKSSIWLIDMPCDVEIRLCVWGDLKWSYSNRTCTFKKMTYRDYLVQNYNENQPTIWDLINDLDTDETQTTYNSRSFWKWLDKYF